MVQDIFLTRTAQFAHVVLPASSSWCEAEGTVTNSERRVQRVRKALEPPGDARDDIWIIAELAKRLGVDLGHPTAEEIWNEVRQPGAELRRDELRAPGAGRRAALALLRRASSGRAVPAQPPSN